MDMLWLIITLTMLLIFQIILIFILSKKCKTSIKSKNDFLLKSSGLAILPLLQDFLNVNSFPIIIMLSLLNFLTGCILIVFAVKNRKLIINYAQLTEEESVKLDSSKTINSELLKNETILNTDISLQEDESNSIDTEQEKDEIDNSKEAAQNQEISEIYSSDGQLWRLSYLKGFVAKLNDAEHELRQHYLSISAHLKSYQRIKQILNFNSDTYKISKLTLAKMEIEGKSLVIYLNLDPNVYDMRNFKIADLKVQKNDPNLRLIMDVDSNDACEYCKILIDDLMKNNNVVMGAIQLVDEEHLQTLSFKELIRQELIKIVVYISEGAFVKKEQADDIRKLFLDKLN